MITNPEKAINTDVPRSGCLKIRAVGSSTSINDTTIFVLFKGIEPDAIYLATTSGIAIFSSSEGWKDIPISIHRVALFLVSPKKKTAIRSIKQIA